MKPMYNIETDEKYVEGVLMLNNKWRWRQSETVKSAERRNEGYKWKISLEGEEITKWRIYEGDSQCLLK